MQIEVSELSALIGGNQAKTFVNRSLGIQIVIVDRGFVFAGKTSIEGEFVSITDAKCIRVWGTTKGLGELVDGPLSSTKLDACGTVLIPMNSVISFIQCNRGW